ncbi:MAG: DUF726 domain-containing protein [Cyanobacteriota bacterium]|nr:DUF726 domain-containing protein [Cyanobacteriota bacterium]
MDRPYLVPIEPSLGVPEALIFIDGYISERTNKYEDNSQWWEVIRQVGWKGSIYYLYWDTSAAKISLESFARLGVEALAKWQKYKSLAKRIGKSYLPKLTWELTEESVSLIGVSLGAYVAYYAMRDWFKASVELKNAILLAAAIRRDSGLEWGKAASHLSGKLIDVYNSEDLILKRFCQILEWERSPCGIKPILEEHPQIINVNATRIVPTAEHSSINYLPVLKDIIAQQFWEI